jgi:hypothetical protein
MEQLLQQLQQQLQQAGIVLKEQEETIQNAKVIVEENRTLKEKLMQLQAEYIQKMQISNQILEGLGKQMQEVTGDAKLMANEVAQNRGLIPKEEQQPPLKPQQGKVFNSQPHQLNNGGRKP